MSLVTGVRWFTAGDCVGIVQVVQDHEIEEYRQTGTAEFKYYIAKVVGRDDRDDVKFVQEWGAKFPKDAGDVLFGEK